jgi:hypothetical protein
MGSVTYYVSMAFDRDEAGDLVAFEPMESRTPAAAVARARSLGWGHRVLENRRFNRMKMSDPDTPTYADLPRYAEVRTKELSALLAPYVDVTDRYGVFLCRLVVVLGRTKPTSVRDSTVRDLIADVFDFLYEARSLIAKGKLEIAYPLARRAYESLSLLVACEFDTRLADRWISGKQIGNAEVRRVLAAHPMGEREAETRELYDFFSKTTHPNRTHMAHRYLGEGNEFVLGAIGMPSLAMLADYALKTLNLWFWFAAFVAFTYRDVISKSDPELLDVYHDAAHAAKPVAAWLRDQFNRVLAEEQQLDCKT